MKKRLLTPAARGNLLLLLAAFIWGVAFVAQKEGGAEVGDLTFNGVRSFIGGTVLLIAIPFLRKMGLVHLPTTAKGWKTTLLGGVLCGVALFLATNLQQIGISYTSVGKSGFITALYIVLVPVLGVFLAGLALNRQIPNLSPLMNKINFVGNALFIPVFLISVGLLIDLQAFTQGWSALVVAILMTVATIGGKWLAAAMNTAAG